METGLALQQHPARARRAPCPGSIEVYDFGGLAFSQLRARVLKIGSHHCYCTQKTC